MALQQTLLYEKVSGLSESFTVLNSINSQESASTDLITKLTSSLKNLNNFMESIELSLNDQIKLSNSLLSECDLVSHLKSILMKSEEKIVKPYKTLIQTLRDEIHELNKTCAEMKEKNEILELRVFNFLQEIEKHRRNTRLSLIFSDPTEKICGNCQKIFKPLENFSWSCKHHKVKIVNNSWYCCGQVGDAAQGCVLGKHISVEEMEEELQNEKYENLFCVNCRNKEHKTNNCPFDPNIRSAHEPNEELKRVEKNLMAKVKVKTRVLKFNRSLMARSASKAMRVYTEDSEISDMDLEDLMLNK